MLTKFTFSGTRIFGFFNDAKILSIGRMEWPQSANETDGRTDGRAELI